MFRYYLSNAFRNIKRNPALSFLVVSAIAVGIGVSITMLTLFYVMGSNPIPQKEGKIFAVQIDSWNPIRPFNSDKPERAPHQLTWRDATNLLEASQGDQQVAMFEAQLILQKDDKTGPFEVRARATSADFFPMFDVPFIYGGGWSRREDASTEQVIVLDKVTNERMFGGENSVGEQITVNNRIFTISGVMDHWEPVPRFYDAISGGGMSEVRDVFVPISLTRPMEINSAGSDWGWKSEDIVTFDDWLNSESCWIQYWVALDGSTAKDAYLTHLDAYVSEQKAMGRFGRPLNNAIHTVSEWMIYHEVVRNDVRVLLGLGFLFLVVCLLSSISLLLTKFNGHIGEMSPRRALGANRMQIIFQNLVEVALLGATGGLLGLVLTQFSLKGIEKGIETAPATLFQLDWTMVGSAITIAILTSLMAGVYPAIRSCVLSPAHQLKTQ